MQIVLVEPEIPQNTGNIARTCALTKTALHLVKPLGFSLADRFLKRAGLDYWDKVEVQLWESFGDLLEANPGAAFYLATTRAGQAYHQVSYPQDSWLVFGRESSGLPISILKSFPDTQIRIPMQDIGRSLNLSNSVAIILYEALRQNSFPGLR
ncbi:tRNA (cytidine(34)-2'-O)-methyltransferase [Syntrophomonas wolfei]|uniref:Putative tRNA (cytidine(34)-2'-O)-methyltransferase n=1 Tax=Syntrophomonas wolfei subsp. wolfei (strain DSM 2245B / Goettingen) TaxID=335541 RepID=Q0AV55_SYNWW|nr:tRNA (cytidine(34)-2'-O)-methyltransferase [Syntrophomonas wolfei]ABI69399.1 rRNA methylase (SpoU class) [Syntrophomonas wolfei subsp. wolfei str. Goettingen G311]